MSGPEPPVTARRASRPLPTPPVAQLDQLDLNNDGILDAPATEGLPSYRDSIVPAAVPEEPPQLETRASVRVSVVREKQALEEYGQAHTPAGSEKGSSSNQTSPAQTEWSHIPFPEPQPSPRRPQYPDQPTPTYSEKDRTVSRRQSTQRPASIPRPISPVESDGSVIPFPAPPPISPVESDGSVVPFPAPLAHPTPNVPVTPPRTALTEKQRLERHYRAQESQTPPPTLDLTNAPDEQIVRGAPPIPPAYGALTSSTSRRRTDGVPLPPTELQRVDYGSRFIPHSYAPVTSTLAIIDGFSLLGTSQGLSALIDGPNGGVKPIWTGFPVWDMKLLRHDGSSDAPRGSVLFHCGGLEDGSTGRPKKDAEARVYKLDALCGLARWASQQNEYDGLDLAASRKGKGKAFSFKGSFNSKSPPKRTSASRQGEDLAMAWANEYNSLPGDTTNVMSISTFIKPEEINIALSTPNSIIVHVGTQTPAGSYTFAPPRPFYIPFTPTTFSFVELEIQGSLPETREDNGSALFEWDDAESIMDIGEAVVGRTLGLFTTFSGARGCVIRTADSGVVELKKGGRGEWLPLQRVRSGEAEVYLFTRGAETFVFPAPLAAPLAIQAPIADLTWPELPIAVHAIPGTRSDIQLLGITASGTIHVIDITASVGGSIQKDWASVQGTCGTKARFLGTRGDGGVDVASKQGDKEWRVIQLHG